MGGTINESNKSRSENVAVIILFNTLYDYIHLFHYKQVIVEKKRKKKEHN